jgi:hypothetical protein
MNSRDLAEVTDLNEMNAAVVQEELWDSTTSDVGEGDEKYEEDEDFAEYLESEIAPFSRQFLGLAHAQRDRLTPERLPEVLGSLPHRGSGSRQRPGLLTSFRSSAGTGREQARHRLPIATVLRSWEYLFGARLLNVGFDQIHLLVERPPRTPWGRSTDRRRALRVPQRIRRPRPA